MVEAKVPMILIVEIDICYINYSTGTYDINWSMIT